MNYQKTTPLSGNQRRSKSDLGRDFHFPCKLAATPITYTADVMVALALLARHWVVTQHSVALMPVSLPTCLQMEMTDDGWRKRERQRGEAVPHLPLALDRLGALHPATDHEQTARVAKETKKEVMLFTQKVAEESAKLWNDVHDRVRHCFLNYNRPVTVLQPGGDRG